MDFPGGASAKESVCQSGDVRDTGSVPGLGRIPWTEEPRGLQSIGAQRVRHN